MTTPNLLCTLTFHIPNTFFHHYLTSFPFHFLLYSRLPLSSQSDMSKSWTAGGGGGTALTMSQQLQLEQIRHRDAEFDTELDEIGEGIQDLRELAMRQGEEVRRQNVMLTNTASRIDDAHEHMTNVNAKMKETLKEVGRSSDKLCVDIMCIVSSHVLLLIYIIVVGGCMFCI